MSTSDFRGDYRGADADRPGPLSGKRPHQGRMMEGQTPYRMFKKGLKLIPKEVRIH